MSTSQTRLAVLLTLALGGCETPMSGLGSKVALEAFQPITLSCKDTAGTRKQIIDHNSAYDSLKQGKAVAYKDGCPAPKPVAAPKTS